jgi:hypothetical protein
MAKKFRDLLAQMPKERVERIEKRAQEELAKMRPPQAPPGDESHPGATSADARNHPRQPF